MEVAALGLRVQSEQVEKASRDLDRFTGAADRAERSAGGLARGSENTARAMDRMESAGRRSSTTMANMAMAATRLGVALGAALSVRALVQYADGWSDMQSRVGAAIKNMEAAPRMMERLVEVANASYSPLQQTVEIFGRNVSVMREMGRSAEDAADFTESLNHMLVITATKGQQAESVQNALSKAMAVGKLEAEGLESVLASGGRVAEALAGELGTTVNGLRKMASEGKITSDVITNALLGSLEDVRREAAEMPATIGDAFVRIQTNLNEFIGRLDQASGVSGAVAEGLIGFADGIRTATNYMIAFGQFAAPAFDAVGAAISSVMEYADIALVAMAGFASPALVAGVWALSAALVTGVAGGIRAITAVMMANPIGLLVGAIAAGVYAAYKFRDDIKEAIGVDVVEVFKTSANFVIGSFVGAYDSIKFVWNNFGDMMGAAVIGGVNIAIRAINGLIQKATEGVDGLIALINKIPGVDVGSIGKSLGINEIANPYADRLGASFSGLNDRVAAAMNKDYIGALGERFKALRTATQAEEEFRKATEATSKATGGTTKAIGAATKAQQEFEKERQSALRAQYQSISAIHDQARAIEDEVALYGMSKAAIEDLTIARLEEQATALRMYGDRSKEAVEAIEREIEARKRLRTAIGSLEQKEAERQAWEEWARDVEQIFNRVGQSLTDAIFDGGKSGKELLRDMFKGLTFNVLINPVMGAMQGWVTNQLGGLFGVQNPRQGGGILNAVSNINSLNTLAGGITQWMTGSQVGASNLSLAYANATGLLGGDSIGALIQANGGWEGALSGLSSATSAAVTAGALSAAPSVAASLSTSFGTAATTMASTSFTASLGGGAAAAGASGAGGLMAGLSAAAPWIAGGLAVASLIGGGLFDREPTTRREQRTQVEYSDGLLDITKRDDRVQAGADQAVAQMTAAAIQSANNLFQQVGVDATIESFRSIMASSYKRDRDGVASGGTLRVGDRLIDFGITDDTNPTIQGFGGWSSVDPMQRIGTEIQLSMLEALKAVSDQLPSVLSSMLEVDIRGLDEAGAADLVARFTAITQGASAFLAAIEQMPFDHLRDVTFDAAANMVQFAGGLDNLLAAQQTYYERFYSDAERHTYAVDQLTQALASAGVEMPALVGSTGDMLASYRALVEAQDLNTESGQRAYVVLMQNAGAFADMAEFAGQVADAVHDTTDASRKAADIAREREGLERQLLQLQGNTVELRRRELEALDESNRALQERIWALQDQRQEARAERRDVIAARRAAEQAEREAFEAAVKSYEDGAKAFDELRQTLLSAGDAAGLLGAAIERAVSNPTGKYTAGGVEYDVPRWESDTTAAVFNYAWGVMRMRIARDLSDDISANALRIENAGDALRDLSPNLGRYSEVVGPMAQALTNAVVEASGDIGYAVRDSVYEAMLGVAQRDVYEQFASRGPGLADIRYAQQQAAWASQAGVVRGFGWQYGADVVAYGDALDKLTGRMQSGQITTEQYDAAVEALNRTMPTAAELLGDTEAQLQRMADAAHDVAMAGARSIDHYFGQLRQMAQELEKTEEPINKVTAAIGRMNSFAEAFGVSAAAAGDYSRRTPEAALIAEAAGIAASVLTTRDARAAAEKLAQDEAFAGVEGAALRDMALLVDGIRAFDPDSWERSMIRMSDALGQGVIDEGQFAALFNYSLDVFEDTARATEQLEQSFDRLREAAGSLADELLLDRDLTTLSFGQQYAEAQRQYEDVMRRAMGGDVDAAADLDRVTRGFLERSADSRDEIQYRRDFAVAVNNLRQIETSNPMKEMATEIKRLNSEVEGLRADLREANATVASNTNDTTRELRRINATGIKVQA